MKRYQLLNFYNCISQIDLQVVDKESRTILLNLDILIGDMAEAHEEEVDKIRKRLVRGHEDEIRMVEELIYRLQEAEDKSAIKAKIDASVTYHEIHQQLEEEINRRMMEDVDMIIEDKVTSEQLAQWCADSGISMTLNLLREYKRAGLIS